MGVNAYEAEEGETPETLYIEERVEEEQIQRIITLKKNRDNEKIKYCIFTD